MQIINTKIGHALKYNITSNSPKIRGMLIAIYKGNTSAANANKNVTTSILNEKW